jgi:branched-chain amino acid transport system ATP-binding protein
MYEGINSVVHRIDRFLKALDIASLSVSYDTTVGSYKEERFLTVPILSKLYTTAYHLLYLMGDPYLATENLTRRFDTLVAVDDVSLEIFETDVTAIIGPNGAGKTTLFNLLTGVVRPTSGQITFRGERIDGLGSSKVAKRGIARSYQVTNIFPQLTVHENVRLAAQARRSGFRPRDLLAHYSKFEPPDREATTVLERIGLTDISESRAVNLSHGQQRHLDIAIALASDPDLLLLDEPTAGMSPEETRNTTVLIEALAEAVTIAMIEHDMDVVMGVSDRVAVMNNGRLIAVDSPEAVRAKERVQEAYLRGGIA